SSALLLVARRARLLPAFQLRSQAVQSRLPQIAIAADPGVQLAKRRGPQRVQPAGPVGANADEPRLVEDAQVARDARLVNVQLGDDVVHRLLVPAQQL